jgi:hypothetical protein
MLITMKNFVGIRRGHKDALVMVHTVCCDFTASKNLGTTVRGCYKFSFGEEQHFCPFKVFLLAGK